MNTTEPTEQQIHEETERIVRETRRVLIAKGREPRMIAMFLPAERWRAVREARENLTRTIRRP